jgi:hypothetical protein
MSEADRRPTADAPKQNPIDDVNRDLRRRVRSILRSHTGDKNPEFVDVYASGEEVEVVVDHGLAFYTAHRQGLRVTAAYVDVSTDRLHITFADADPEA